MEYSCGCCVPSWLTAGESICGCVLSWLTAGESTCDCVPGNCDSGSVAGEEGCELDGCGVSASCEFKVTTEEEISGEEKKQEQANADHADPKLNLSEEVEAPQIPSVAFSKSSFSAFSNVGLNLKEKIQNNRVETDEPHEQEVREQNATVELDVDGNKQVGETHDTQQSKRINKRKKNDTQQTKYTPEPRKTTSVVWKFFDKVQENGEVHAKCPVCNKELCAKSRNGTTSLHRHSCFKDWKKDEKQQSVSNDESSAKVKPKNKASPNIGAGAPPQAKRRKLVANVGDEREEEETSSASTNAIVMAEEQYPIVSGIGQAAVSGLAYDQVQELTVQEDYTAKETPEEPLPSETQSSGQQANNMAIDGIGGVPQVECTKMELTAEDQAAQMEEQLKATYEQIEQIKLKLYTLEKEDAVMQISKATADRLEIDSIVAGMPALFDFVKQVPPKP
ncbi:hypothetical protein POTOM_017075 [Populus tomentosa]|uniref:BED-type domain-containing protein n=1 Tax=Populus tomentosa TaxID=118781 RepID=A0A8X8A3N8_POPTO|nr:hypothetical protein POTOM_017075 [Populus tomentosa]